MTILVFILSIHITYRCKDENDILTTTEYGFDFASAVEKENIYATQFHPEKSHKFGMKLMENFSQKCLETGLYHVYCCKGKGDW